MKRVVFICMLMFLPFLSFAQEDALVQKADTTSKSGGFYADWAKDSDPDTRRLAWYWRDMVSVQDDNYDANVPRYRIFPTTNMWTFIKLDTRNGLMWQVQYSVEGEKHRFETVLNEVPLVFSLEDGIDGRFTLIPTQNSYNFILLDQYQGTTYQTQWSIEKENRGVILIDTGDSN